MDDEVAEPEEEAAVLAGRETVLANREAQKAVDQRHDRDASVSTWARRLHEKAAELHDRAEMAHRDAAELHALGAEHEQGRPVAEPPAERSD